MQDHVVSVRVSLVVVLMAVVLMCGTAFAGERFTLRPRADEQKQWPMPSDLDHWSRVDDADGFEGDVDIAAIGQNLSDPDPDPVTDVFDLTGATKPRAVSFWTVQGVICARGRPTPTGTGYVQVWVKKGAQYLNMGKREVWATAIEFDYFPAPLVYTDWTQQEIDGARLKVTGWRPVYPYGASPSGSTHLEEIRVYFYCQ